MADGVNIDFGALKPVADPTATYVNAFQVGQNLAKATAMQNATALYGQDPTAGISAMQGIDPATAQQWQGYQQQAADRQSAIDQATAEGQGNLQGAITAAAARGATGDVATLKDKLDQLPAAQKAAAVAQAQQNNESLAHILIGIKAYPPEQRLGIAQHMAQQTGLLDPSTITADDVSDIGINAHLASAMTMEQFLKSENDKANLALRQQKENFDESKPDYHFGQPGEVATMISGGQLAPASGPIADQISAEAARQGVDPKLALAIAFNGEGNGKFLDPSATSPKGAIGTMQLLPTTARGLGVDPTNPADNIRGGVAYIAQLQKKYGNDPAKIAAAYNAGPGAVDAAGGVPNFPETQSYVGRVMGGASGGGGQGLPTRPGQSGTIGAAPSSGAAPGDTSKNGADYLATLPQAQATQVKALAEGRMKFPSGMALKTPYWQQMISAVGQYDPTFDEVNEGARAKTRAAFTSGPAAQNITSINTVVNHLGSLYDSIDKMQNSDFQPLNAFTHMVGNATGNTNYSQFEAAKQAVASELVRTLRGASGNESDIKAWQAQLDATKSPAQLKATIQEAVHLIAGRLQPLADQYNTGMGTTKDPLDLLRPDGQAVVNKILGGKGQAAAPRPTAGTAPARGSADAALLAKYGVK